MTVLRVAPRDQRCAGDAAGGRNPSLVHGSPRWRNGHVAAEAAQRQVAQVPSVTQLGQDAPELGDERAGHRFRAAARRPATSTGRASSSVAQLGRAARSAGRRVTRQASTSADEEVEAGQVARARDEGQGPRGAAVPGPLGSSHPGATWSALEPGVTARRGGPRGPRRCASGRRTARRPAIGQYERVRDETVAALRGGRASTR